MNLIVAGEPDAVSTLAARLETASPVAVWAPAEGAGDDSIARLARTLTDLEAEATGQQAEAILLADDSDTALAAALVGAKLPVEVLAVDAAREPASANGRLIAQLAAAYTGPA